MIRATHLSKTFVTHRKEPGLLGSLKSLVRRERVEKVAVRDVSFEVGEGEIVGLIGANGAGKTTLVKMLSGIVRPSGGEARVLGFDPWKRDDRFRSQIALLMGQKAQLWWDLPAADGFLLLKEIYRIPDAQYREDLAALSSMLRVEKELTVPIRRLSLGERMKMELVASLLHRPKVVFLDEPTIGLDVAAQRAVRDFLLEVQATRRPAMLLTSHYMDDIERLCKRVLVIREGTIVFDGRLADVVTRFAPEKVVTAHLKKVETPVDAATACAGVGELVEATDVVVRVRVPRDGVAAAASALLQRLPVADLAIEEPDISLIVERILFERRDPTT